MPELGMTLGPEAAEKFANESVQLYRKGRIVWVVDERDRVYVTVQGRKTAIGYNHSRAWRGMMTRYSPYFNPGDVEFWSQADCDLMEEVVANRKPLPEPALPIED